MSVVSSNPSLIDPEQIVVTKSSTKKGTGSLTMQPKTMWTHGSATITLTAVYNSLTTNTSFTVKVNDTGTECYKVVPFAGGEYTPVALAAVMPSISVGVQAFFFIATSSFG